MKVTRKAQREAKDLFRVCMVNGLLDEDRVRQVTKLVIGDKPRGYLAILQHFHRLVKLDVVRRTARVESAVPLSADRQTRVRENLAKAYGPGLEVGFVETPALVGGMCVRVGSDVYDGSIRGRLRDLEQSF